MHFGFYALPLNRIITKDKWSPANRLLGTDHDVTLLHALADDLQRIF